MAKEMMHNPQEIWAAWRKDETLRALSSSGGLASAISEEWIEKGGIVYGAAFVKPFSFQHVRCENIQDLSKLRGSKYVQSSVSNVISYIDKDLRNGKRILFVGTPCQVAGIRKRFQNYEEQLYTIDVICHGAPTLQILKDSLPLEVLKMDFDEVEFRHENIYRFRLKKDGNIVWERNLSHDLYMKGFFKAVFCREACFHCKYASIERCGDVTLGDFWGVDLKAIDLEKNKGISLVLVNTNNGRVLLDSVNNKIDKVERPLSEAVEGNQPLQRPMPLTWRYRTFKMLYPKWGFKWAAICAMPDIVLKNLFK